MTADIIRRFLWMIPVLLMVTMVTFGAMKVILRGRSRGYIEQ
jgi:ABC-type dipeptide/oligopeptide/nickel transport system permease component